jgi:hypothetical protein
MTGLMSTYEQIVATQALGAIEMIESTKRLVLSAVDAHLNRLGNVPLSDPLFRLIGMRLVRLQDAKVALDSDRMRLIRSEDGSEAQGTLTSEVHTDVMEALEQVRYAQMDIDEYAETFGGGLRARLDVTLPQTYAQMSIRGEADDRHQIVTGIERRSVGCAP